MYRSLLEVAAIQQAERSSRCSVIIRTTTQIIALRSDLLVEMNMTTLLLRMQNEIRDWYTM